MKQKEILVISIVVILAILLCLTTFLMVNSHEETLSTLRISNSCTIDVPLTNNTVEHSGGVTKYIFASNELNITHQKTLNNSEIKKVYSDMIKNSEEVEKGIYFDSSTGFYFTFIENNETGDALLITAKDMGLLKRISNSVKFTVPSTLNTTDNTSDDTVEDTPVEEYDTYYEEYYPTYETTTPTDEGSSESQENTPQQ